MVDFVDQPLATFAVGDAKYAWDWNWRFNETWGARGHYTKADYDQGTIKLDKGWEFEQHTVNDFSFTKRSDPFLNESLALQPDWLRMKGCITPIARETNYPVRYAIRTAGLVRGGHPYALVLDDIRKDDAPHDYTWYFTLEYDVQIVKVARPNTHQLDIVLTGDNPAQTNAPRGNTQASAPLPVLRGANAAIPDGQPMLLVRFLNIDIDPKSVPATEAREVTILEDAPDARYKGHMLQRIRRLAVPVHTVEPGFKTLLYPYRQGQPLPTTEWIGKNAVSVAWDGQKDKLEFSPTPAGKTNLKITRGSETLATVDKPVPPLAEVSK